MSDEKSRIITRREILKGAGAVAAAAASGVAMPGAAAPGALSAGAGEQAPVREALEALTAQEADLLDLITARLIPTDALGPGATTPP